MALLAPWILGFRVGNDRSVGGGGSIDVDPIVARTMVSFLWITIYGTTRTQ